MKPKAVPQVIIKPYISQPGANVIHFDENHERIPDSDEDNQEQQDPQEGETERSPQNQSDPIPDLDPIMANEPENLVPSQINTEIAPESNLQSENRYFTRSQAKRKRADSEKEDGRINKIVKAMIAQLLPSQEDDEFEHAFPATEVCGIPIPTTYKEAVNDPKYGNQWWEAIREELVSLLDNGTWEVVAPPKGANIVTSKWVFTIKTTQTGEVERFKTRLVARGFSQVKGEDYHETFAPIVRLDSLRLFLTIAAIEDLECRQYDIKNAFTESHLKEKIYMAVPEGFATKKGQVLKIMRSLYGLK